MSVGYWSNVITGSQPSTGWTTVASSSTGQYCIAGNTDTNLYISSDYGQNWAITNGTNAPTNNFWNYVAITQDGNKMAACVGNGGNLPLTIYILDKNGANANTWIDIIPNSTYNYPTNPGTNTYNWLDIAFSYDTNILAACNSNSDIWLYNIVTSTWSVPPLVSNYIPQQFPARGGYISSNINGFIFASPQNSIYSVYYDGNGGYISSIWTVGNTYIDGGAYDGYPWTSISSSLDGNTIVLCSYSGNDTIPDNPRNKIYIGTFIPISPGGSFSGNKTLELISQSSAGTGKWNSGRIGPDAVSIAASKADGINPGEIWVGNKSYGNTTYSWVQQTYQGSPLNSDWSSISRSTDPNQYTKFVTLPRSPTGTDKTGIWIFTSYQTANDAQKPLTCFKKDSKILTDKGYIAVQNLKKGDLIKTLFHGFVPIYQIRYKEMYNPCSKERIKNQLYKCSKPEYPEIFEDLVITGCHSILVDEFNEGEREKTSEVLGRIFATDDKYRLPACVDKRAKIYPSEGFFLIYHIALENNDYYMNYGIYANGLLVETCSKRYLEEKSEMKIL